MPEIAEVEVVFARVPAELKRSVESYADGAGKTLTSAVTDLLERGLAAASDKDSVAALRRRISELERLLKERDQGLADAQARMGTLEERERDLHALAQRASQRLGSCPNAECGGPINGYDLLGTGTCPHCHRGLSGLITAPQDAGVDRTEMLVLIAALGLVLAAAYVATKKS